MDVPQPVLLLVVPADWDAGPEAVTEIRPCLGEDYGGRLMLKMATTPLRSPLAHDCGLWGWAEPQLARRDLTPPVAAAFYTLDWMDLDKVS